MTGVFLYKTDEISLNKNRIKFDKICLYPQTDTFKMKFNYF